MANNPKEPSNHISLRWRNLTLINPKDDKHLLSDLNGVVQSGDFLSIMGPSGAGKSSLLSILTQRLTNNNTKLTLQGDTLLNGYHYDINTFSKISAYVQQDDLLFGTLTVRETFFFQAKLKLWQQSKQQQEERCQDLLKKLNLLECSNTLIGNNQFKKSISGGQKKRVSIGVELISNPHVLVFDQPTSGLDSHNALIIMRTLENLAKNENKIIISTIHQPSTLIFRNMDKLYLLNLGQCVYFGSANQIVPYMENLQIKVDYRMNPADFFMLEISSFKAQSGHITQLNSDNFTKKHPFPQDHFQLMVKQGKYSGFQGGNQTVPYSHQFTPLLLRSFRNFYRLPSNQLNKVLAAFIIPFFLGLIYYRIGDEVPSEFDPYYLLKVISLMFMGLYFTFAFNVYDTVLVFPVQKTLVFKEVGSGLYSIFIYFISRLSGEIIGCLLPALISGTILYFSTGLDTQLSHIIIFYLLYVLMAVQGYFFGLLFGVLCRDEQTATNMLPMVVIPILLFGGLAVNINTIPEYIRWMQYLSPLRHSFLILFQDQMKTDTFAIYAGLNLPELYGVGGDARTSWICFLSLLVGFFLVSLLLLYILKKRI